jgi:ATP-dependent HslUV protease ATP-binding subunit HslU
VPDHEQERELTPRQIVAELDRDIVGQADAKRAVAIALRNRWRRRQLAEDVRQQVTPKNIMLIGPTGVGKTEIARRLAMLVGAPFVKAEATKYTEVGYVGRDVEGLIRDLVEAAIVLVRNSERQRVEEQAKVRVEQRLLDLLLPPSTPATPWPEGESPPSGEAADRRQRSRDKMRTRLAAGELDDREVEITFPGRSMAPVSILGAGNFEQMEMDLQNMFEKIMPKPTQTRRMTIRQARPILLQQEVEGLIDPEKISQAAVSLTEESGIVFIDEIDKVTSDEGSSRGPDVSRQGVQRDLLPIVEGTTVNTKHGPVKTDYILFIAAGAFHRSKPSDLMPELQGRFPIRVEMHDLTRDDFARILREPRVSLIRQYQALLSTEGITLEFADAAIEVMADLAFQVNRSTQNIGARRLHTLLERVVEDLSFNAPDREEKHVVIDEALVRERLEALSKDEDLSRFIL